MQKLRKRSGGTDLQRDRQAGRQTDRDKRDGGRDGHLGLEFLLVL